MYGQGLLLVLRTLLTDYVSRLEGQAGRWIIQQDFAVLSKVLAMFVAVSAELSRGGCAGSVAAAAAVCVCRGPMADCSVCRVGNAHGLPCDWAQPLQSP